MIKFSKKEGCCNAPYSVNISVTEKCPLRCPFCFHEYGHNQELNYQTVCSYIDELSLLGTVQVQFSGGEPMIYPHLLEVVSYAHYKRLHTIISSSGIGITKEMAYKLKKAGLDCCCISLNGSNEEIHKFTRDGFKYAIQALENLSKVGLKSAINWVAYHENVSDLPQLISLSKFYDVKYISVLPMKKNYADITLKQLNKNDFIELVFYCNEFKNYLVVDSCFRELNVALKKNRFLDAGCRAGIFYMAISASGEFSGCPHLVEEKRRCTSIEQYWKEDDALYNHRENRFCSYIQQVVDNQI